MKQQNPTRRIEHAREQRLGVGHGEQQRKLALHSTVLLRLLEFGPSPFLVVLYPQDRSANECDERQ